MANKVEPAGPVGISGGSEAMTGIIINTRYGSFSVSGEDVGDNGVFRKRFRPHLRR
jgi:hypothetical protein